MLRSAHGKISLTILVCSVSFGITALQFPGRLTIFPLTSSVIVSVAALLDLNRIRLSVSAGAAVTAGDRTLQGVSAKASSYTGFAETQEVEVGPFVAIAWFLLLMASIFTVGFLWAIPIYMVAFMRIQGRIAWKTVFFALALTWSVMYWGFVVVLNQRVFPGYLFI